MPSGAGGAVGSGATGAVSATEPRKLMRPDDDRIVAGVCSGLAVHLGVSVRLVRLVLVALNVFGGAGLMAYVLLWVATPTGDPEPPPGAPAQPDARAERAAARTPAQFLLVGVALLVAAVAITTGLGSESVPDFLASALPLFAVGVGAVVAWTDIDVAAHPRAAGRTIFATGGRRALVRVIGGVVLAATGFIVLVARGQGLAMAWDVTVATVAVLAGVGLVLAPLVLRLWRRYQDEQASRIRETARADIAAHLHDSVLQTLALIQRTDDPQRVSHLARAQERELRAWLYGGATTSCDTLAGAVTAVAHEIDDLHGVAVDLVVTGDRPLDEGGEALVRALREALLNAVRHGAPPVSAYVEVGPDLVEAFIRDHGSGFDPDDVPEDRLGVRESIIGRMQRHGGTARIRRLDEGTEVALTLPVDPGEQPAPEARPSAASPPSGRPAAEGAAPAVSDPSAASDPTEPVVSEAARPSWPPAARDLSESPAARPQRARGAADPTEVAAVEAPPPPAEPHPTEPREPQEHPS